MIVASVVTLSEHVLAGIGVLSLAREAYRAYSYLSTKAKAVDSALCPTCGQTAKVPAAPKA